MKKILFEMTPEQYLSLTNILTSISIGYYDELPSNKNKVIEILDSIKAPKVMDTGKAVLNEGKEIFPEILLGQTISGYDKDDEISSIEKWFNEPVSYNDLLPDEWFDTYNVSCENNPTLDLISDDENLRFIFGKQGQVGIEYWSRYDEDESPEAVIFIKNSDASEMLEYLDHIIEPITNNRVYSRGISKEICCDSDSKYSIKVLNLDNEISAYLTKNKPGKYLSEVIKFHNSKQIILFYEFLKHHLGLKNK